MRLKNTLFLKKRFYLPLLLVVVILLPVIFFAFVYFSPGHIRHFQIGNRLVEINLYGGDIDIYYPKGETGYYHFHNLSWPQDIGLNRTYTGSPSPASVSLSQQISTQVQKQFPKSDQTFTSRLANFTLTIPAENYSEMHLNNDSESLIMWITPDDYNKDGEERLDISVYPVSKGCQDTSKTPSNGPTHINLAGKYPISLIHSSVSHGDSGQYYHGVSQLENGYCLEVSIKYDRKYEQKFIDILEGN